ncbi:MAG: type II toxin-antitoxin system RelE/ParE family toxin [Magnetococcales bacterium]|nr:type II toxin-antitoxin system RelE/ParE family toxin [Magnetococcales bacterium]
MEARFRLTPLAREDLRGIRGHIAGDNLRAAKRILQLLQTKCHLLAQNPGLDVSLSTGQGFL